MSSYEAFAYVYDELTDDVPYRERAAYFDRILNGYTTKKGILLDLACGTGSLSEEFSLLGYDVIGVDCSEDMLCVAMEKKLESGADITYLCQKMQDLDLYGTVDVAICALDSLNHITEKEELQKAISRVSLFLDPEGYFLFDLNTPYKHREILGNHTFVYDYEDVYLVWRNTQLPENTVQIDLTIFEQEDDAYFRTDESFCERAYTKEEIEEILKKAGLQVLAVYQGDTLASPGPESERWVYVTKKEKRECQILSE